MSRRKPKNKDGAGRALIKAQQQKKGARRNEGGEAIIHSTDEPVSQESILTQNSFDSLMEYAEMSGKNFEVIKERAVIVQNEAFHVHHDDPSRLEEMEKHWNELTIPKRPMWNKNTTKEELIQSEKESFLEWRKSLLDLEKNEKFCVTPFEKNLEVWRQLWRVVEKSQIVVQIADARNPLFFRALDLEKYVNSLPGKQNLLLVNKADLLTVEQRKAWARHFIKEGVEFLFFSAFVETEKNEQREAEPDIPSGDEEEESGSTDSETDEADFLSLPVKAVDVPAADVKESETVETKTETSAAEPVVEPEPKKDEVPETEEERIVREKSELIGADDLVKLLIDACHLQTQRNIVRGIGEETELCDNVVGMVGYPNVGKSSTINAIAGCKKVQVSQTPGKTKHFQTIILPNTPLTLCDCPGLVFPSFLSTKNEMYCNGLLRIAEIREVYGPVSYVCRKIPRAILEHIYGISLPKPAEGEDPNSPPTAQQLMDRHAYIRGYMNRHGQPDNPRSARVVLNDFVSGKLLYACPPPGLTEEEYSPFEERLALAGVITGEHDDGHASGEEEEGVDQKEEKEGEETYDFDVEIDAAGLINPQKEDEDAYMNRIKPKGRKATRRIKENQQFEQQAGAFTTGQRFNHKHQKQRGNQAGPTAILPTSVKVTATKGSKLITVLGTTNTPGVSSTTHKG